MKTPNSLVKSNGRFKPVKAFKLAETMYMSQSIQSLPLAVPRILHKNDIKDYLAEIYDVSLFQCVCSGFHSILSNVEC